MDCIAARLAIADTIDVQAAISCMYSPTLRRMHERGFRLNVDIAIILATIYVVRIADCDQRGDCALDDVYVAAAAIDRST